MADSFLYGKDKNLLRTYQTPVSTSFCTGAPCTSSPLSSPPPQEPAHTRGSGSACPQGCGEPRASPGCGAGPSHPASLSEERDTPGSQPQGCCSHALKFAGKNGLNTSQPRTCFPSAPNLLPKPTAASWNSPCLFHLHQQSFCAQVLHSDGNISR